ncbi:MAG: hypothetical protein HQL15_07215 [Candidatus Omnitrophica bacterium]|nr:hypothetical protein [Candidatus Omnitrophota bacterium]
MLRLIVTDWNRTIFEDYYEETFLKILYKNIFINSLSVLDFGKIFNLIVFNVRFQRVFRDLKGDLGNKSDCIEQAKKLLHSHLFENLSNRILEKSTQEYSVAVAHKLDKRILDPIYQLSKEKGIQIVIISSGYDIGIKKVLENNAYYFDFIFANKFDVQDQAVKQFQYHILNNKQEILRRFLLDHNIPSEGVLYVGDDEMDRGCLEYVGYPVASFFTPEKTLKLMKTIKNIYIPKDQTQFEVYLKGCVK